MPAHQFPPTPPREISDQLTSRILEMKASKEAEEKLQQLAEEVHDLPNSQPTAAVSTQQELHSADAVAAIKINPSDAKGGKAESDPSSIEGSEKDDAAAQVELSNSPPHDVGSGTEPATSRELDSGIVDMVEGAATGDEESVSAESEAALARALTLPTGEGDDKDREL